MQRCGWPNLERSALYMAYHDEEWGVPSRDDAHLFEMFILESFHCGLSWLLVLQKRENFRAAFDGFDAERMAEYDDAKVAELLENPGIVRNRAKILAAIANARAFLRVREECGSFSDYLWGFVGHTPLREPYDLTRTKNALSDTVSKDLKRRGFKFMGSVTCYSYLEAVGIMNHHAPDCFCYDGGAASDC